jgi:hypothetical protein
MEYGEIEGKVIALANYIDGTIEGVDKAAIVTQALIYDMIRNEILKFEIKEAKFVIGQDLRKRLATIQNKIESILGSKSYAIPIRHFLTDFDTIQDRTVNLFKSVKDLEIEVSELSPAKQVIYDQAKDALTKAVAAEYVEPVKKLIAQNVMQGRSITDTVRILEKWDNGDLASGRLAAGERTPNLQKYATQMARDSAYSIQRTTNNIFKERFGLTKFIYAGTLVKDSRPLCRHLVHLNRPIDINEMPPLIAAMPEGLYPNTTRENFTTVCGGYNCSHLAHMVS